MGKLMTNGPLPCPAWTINCNHGYMVLIYRIHTADLIVLNCSKCTMPRKINNSSLNDIRGQTHLHLMISNPMLVTLSAL